MSSLPEPPATPTSIGGRRLVPVRPYVRTVEGHVQQVGGYTQSRDARHGKPFEKQGGPVETEKSVKPEPDDGSQSKRVVIFVGGAADGLFRPVRDYADWFARNNSDVRTAFFSHDQPTAIKTFIEHLPAGTQISLVGHSWGGDTAAQVAARLGEDGRHITGLITVDPVGNFPMSNFYARVLSGTKTWLNVNAVGGSWWESSNLVAALGGPYGGGPRGFAQGFIEAPVPHGDFGNMLRGSVFRGLTLEDRLRGVSLPKAAP